jgi:hypothetical protein
MLLSNPPCTSVSYDIWWESSVDGVCDVKFSVFGTYDCAEGITLANLIDEVFNRRCSVKVHTLITDNHWLWDSTFPGCFDTNDVMGVTVNEEIGYWESRNVERVTGLSKRSQVNLISVIAPTEYEHDQVNKLGRMKVSYL